jgi:large subunit ribosomal protein L32
MALALRAVATTPFLSNLGAFAFPALALPTFHSLLDLFPPFVLAVPKKKVSHSRKAMRSANKGLEDKHSMLVTFITYFIGAE